jgi:hypothetical protein
MEPMTEEAWEAQRWEEYCAEMEELGSKWHQDLINDYKEQAYYECLREAANIDYTKMFTIEEIPPHEFYTVMPNPAWEGLLLRSEARRAAILEAKK